MNGFAVNPTELLTAARSIHALSNELATTPAESYTIQPNMVGDAELAIALSEFQSASTHVVRRLVGNATSTAIRLQDSAAEYLTVDCANASIIENAGRMPDKLSR